MSLSKRSQWASLLSTFCLLLLLVPLILAFLPGKNSASARDVRPIGPKQHYLALGDSLAFGYQPDLALGHGYVDELYTKLQHYGTNDKLDLGCPGESSSTMINGGCPTPLFLFSNQLDQALAFIKSYPGEVSPVTLDIGAGDLLGDVDANACTVNENKFEGDLATLDSNLTQIILPKLFNALTINGELTGDIVLMNYYDPYQNQCPTLVRYIQRVNEHLAEDIRDFGFLADVFDAFGGADTPNPHICQYTWECSQLKDIHPTDEGYRVIAASIEETLGIN